MQTSLPLQGPRGPASGRASDAVPAHLQSHDGQQQHRKVGASCLSTSGRTWPSYEARHYSVTPLGARSALIQWVNGATPLFHIYRKWQLRQVRLSSPSQSAGSNQGSAGEEEGGAGDDRGVASSGGDLLREAASESQGVAVATRRDRRPLSLARIHPQGRPSATHARDTQRSSLPVHPFQWKIFLFRELWMRAGSGDTWWRVIERFSRSAAVTSVLGAVLGLGDRHLDNVLVSLETGQVRGLEEGTLQVVHIDYNVCFEKGRQLRVPETVPFRLTPNLVHALGPSYTEVFQVFSRRLREPSAPRASPC